MNICYKPILLISVMIFSLLSGCVKDNDDDCRCGNAQGLNIYFYSKTICQADTVYPEEIKDITLCLFDKNDILVTHTQYSNIELTREYFQQLEVNKGLYTIIAWSGLTDENLSLTELQEGNTTKNDLLFRLKRSESVAGSLEGTRLFYGISSAIYVEKNKDSESQWEDVKINMQELTNRLTITVEGLENPGDFEIVIESNNGSVNINGTTASDEILTYEASYTNEKEILEAQFTILKLETGLVNTIVIRDKTDDTEVFRGNLLGTLLFKNPEVNLACDHDFVIRFTAEDQCDCGTYMITEIWVNNWLVHSYDTQM